MEYRSEVTRESSTLPGVKFRIARLSLGRRLELTRRIWNLTRRAEYLEAGGSPAERLQAAALSAEIDRAYLEWGLLGIEGLQIDGEPAGVSELAERGPEGLALEIVAAIRSECGLSEAERKN